MQTRTTLVVWNAVNRMKEETEQKKICVWKTRNKNSQFSYSHKWPKAWENIPKRIQSTHFSTSIQRLMLNGMNYQFAEIKWWIKIFDWKRWARENSCLEKFSEFCQFSSRKWRFDSADIQIGRNSEISALNRSSSKSSQPKIKIARIQNKIHRVIPKKSHHKCLMPCILSFFFQVENACITQSGECNYGG